MIEIENLTKKFGRQTAVDAATFNIEPGKITAFLGPNGAGKSTTLKMMVGLESPDGGSAKFDGKIYRDLPQPAKTVGAYIDAKSFHPNRSARAHLKIIAAAAGIGDRRVDEVLDLVGLSGAARKKIGKFSLGMTGRLGIAAAVLGEPDYLLLDEPFNGLDPEGVIWVREFCKAYAKAGRTVFLSSHNMAEVEHIADAAVIIGRGKIIERGTLPEILARSGERDLEKAFIKLTTGSVEFTATGLPKFDFVKSAKAAGASNPAIENSENVVSENHENSTRVATEKSDSKKGGQNV
ncbi:MAG: ATP-binding cassette domain-containing protein [Candidatus Nomurabacteria bacterium]|nr:ATP-binding cassette domain-containing protein [Candidatus Nomurabacteria bacterium]